jgi:hypothetical protein
LGVIKIIANYLISTWAKGKFISHFCKKWRFGC